MSMDEFTSAELAYNNGYEYGFESGKVYSFGVLAAVVTPYHDAMALAILQQVARILQCETKETNIENGGEKNVEKENRNG